MTKTPFKNKLAINGITLFLLLSMIVPLACLGQASPAPFTLKLDSNWRFATDQTDQGITNKWYASGFNDSGWKAIKSGLSWQQQGIVYGGQAWYRQQVAIPTVAVKAPLILNLGKIAYDHQVYFNGTKVGGLNGSYRYTNFIPSYIIPVSLIKFGATNVIAIRVLGVADRGYDGDKSGLASGSYTIQYNPYLPMMRKVSGPDKKEQDAQHFDLSEARYGIPFQMVFRLPAGKFSNRDASLHIVLADYYGGKIQNGIAPVRIGRDGIPQAVLTITGNSAQTIYYRGRFKAFLTAGEGKKLFYKDTVEMKQLSFRLRDHQELAALPVTYQKTPYGKLKLIDEIAAGDPVDKDEHPYMESGYDASQHYKTPGSSVAVKVSSILGKRARESNCGWFAYRIGRGKLKAHLTYLVRIEYPEDKSRYCPVELSTGENYMDIGWKNGCGADNPYDNWPLSHKWQWYDVIIPLDDYTVGTSGANGASSQYGLWLYFMNKRNDKGLFPMYEGGPAVARIRLYEIDPVKNAPVIRKPQGLPQRTLMMDWERQAIHQYPSDIVNYCKLMGYNTVSPVIVKWAFANYSPPFNGYHSYNVDNYGYWIQNTYDPKAGKNAGVAVPGKTTVFEKYLAATRESGVNLVPRIEYGGSLDLPDDARAVGTDGKLAKPNRFADWGADLLKPATWDDLSRLIDHLFKPYYKYNPQLTGAFWRVRSDRMQTSYSPDNIEMFAKETGTKLPDLSDQQLAVWAATGEGSKAYTEWWHCKRAEFHQKVAGRLKSYRSDMTLYYYNWDGDKFSLGQPDFTAWSFLGKVMNASPDAANKAYRENFKYRASLTGSDYVQMIKTGALMADMPGRPDYGLRPDLYSHSPGIQIIAPANYRYLAGDSTYLNYFKTSEGLAVSNMMVYDEVDSRTINPRFECNETTPAGAAYSMALELLPYFTGDARTLTYTSYTYGRGFADAHRRFAQAFLALPAVKGTLLETGDKDSRVRMYQTKSGIYLGVANKAYTDKAIDVIVPVKDIQHHLLVKDLVSGKAVRAVRSGNYLKFKALCGPMGLNAYVVN